MDRDTIKEALEAEGNERIEFHYGGTEPDPPRTLDDGTIRRYDNSHEDTKGHELHVAPDPDPDSITFPGMVELWERFWSEIPKSEFEVT
jgi:hypothetical protein